MASAHRVVFACLLASLVLVGPASAQTDSATISGRVTDETGDALPGTRVAAVRIETNTSDATETNGSGIYVLRNLRPGVHRLTIEKDGFQTIVVDGLALAVQDVLGRNFTMRIGPVDDVITVAAGVANLVPAAGTLVDREFVEHLPLNGRSFQSLIQLAPGVVVAPAQTGMEGQFSVNGQRTNTNHLTVDGMAVDFAANLGVNPGQNVGGTLPALTVGGGTHSFVSVDAMQEFRTHTSSYQPELGRMPGAQISIVTRSGTNRFRGTAYDYVRDEALDARNWFNRPPEPKAQLRQQDFGATLGGPLRRDRTFFFLSYEGLRLRQPDVVTGIVYSVEATAGIMPPADASTGGTIMVPGVSSIDPACVGMTSQCGVRATAEVSYPTRVDAYSGRFDHTVGRGVSMFMRAGHTPSSEQRESFFRTERLRRDTSLVTTGVSATLGRRAVNDLRIGWGRAAGQVSFGEGPGAVPQPRAQSVGLASGPSAGASSGAVSIGIQQDVMNESRQVQVVDTFSAALGRHDLRIGLDYRHLLTGNQGVASPSLVFVGDAQSLATVTPLGSPGREAMTVSTHNWSLFLQDAWKITPSVTLTYGLRWDVNTPPVSTSASRPLDVIEGVFDEGPVRVAPAGTPLWRTRYDNIAPRAGLTWALTPSTVVRGGTGLFYDMGYGGLLGDLVRGTSNVGTQTGVEAVSAGTLAGVVDASASQTIIVAGPAEALVAFDPALTLPRTWQWHASIDRQLGARHALTVSYVGARGQRLLRPDLVREPLASGQPGTPVMVTRNAGRSRYDALQLMVERRLSHGLQMLAAYSLSSARDTESDDLGRNAVVGTTNAETAASLSQLPVPSLARADFDARHAWSLALSYDLPSPQWGGITEAVLTGWSIDAIARSSSARPINVRIEGVSPHLGTYATQPDVVAGQPIWIAAPDEPAGQVLNPDAFTLPAEGSAGSLRRNSIDSPFGIDQTDLAIRRRFPLPGAASLEFRAEAFNLFNHPMFGGPLSPVPFWGTCVSRPCTGQQNPAFGTVPSVTLNEGLGGEPTSGGQSAIYAIGGSRSIQLSFKLRF